jgi:hypothetical protein
VYFNQNYSTAIWCPSPIHRGFFYDTQYHPVPLVEKDPYVIKKDIYVKI